MPIKNHTQQADTSTDTSTTVHAPTVSETGQRYRYVRCQRGDCDDTVYVHQLCAIAGGADPDDVFSSHWDTHHRPLSEVFDLDEHVPALPLDLPNGRLPPIDTPEAVTLEPRNEHRGRNLQEGTAYR